MAGEWRGSLISALAGLATGTIVFVAALNLSELEVERANLLSRVAEDTQVSGLARELSSELEAAAIETRALADIVAALPAVSADVFDEYSKRVLARYTTLLSATLLPNDVIERVYPPNPELLGLDVGRHPVQHFAVDEMKASGRLVITGPIDLKQGGRGLILRAPVHERVTAEQRYWGHVSVVVGLTRVVALIDDFQKQHDVTVSLVDENASGLTAGLRLGGTVSDDSQSRIIEVGQEVWLLKVSQVQRPTADRGGVLSFGGGLAVLTGVGTLLLGLMLVRLRAQNRHLAVSQHQALEAARSKATFLATMSHELRTPLNGVIASAELLADTQSNTERSELISTISSSSRALLAVINDVLDFSKLEAGKMSVELIPTQLRPLLADVEAITQHQARAKSIGLRFIVADDVPAAIATDPVRLRQTLLNLTSNAVKFTSEGGVSVKVTTLVGSEPRVRFEVVDTGIGMKDPGSVFQEFVQADASTTRRFGGTGLGLAISARIVDLLGGKIRVESAPGVGSTFEFSLPGQAVHVQDATSLRPVTEVTAGRCLVVDDNGVNRMVAQKVLQRLGWAVVLAESGAQALALVRSDSFDVVFMDCQMPEMDGFETTARMRAIPALKDMPIVAMTANASPEDKAQCLAAGMTEHVAKPIRIEALREVIARQCKVA